MKRNISLGPLLLLASCLSNESPINVGPSFPMTGQNLGSCSIATVGQTGGSFDVAGLSVGANYVIGLELQSNLDAPIIADTLGTEQGSKTDNDFIFSSIQLGYQAVPPIGLPASETTAAAGAVIAGANGTSSWLGLYLFGPKAAQTLATAVAPGSESTVTVTATLKGALRSGEAMNSNSFAYPITVFNSGFAGCPVGDRVAANGPCGTVGSQDGTAPTCCSVDGGTQPTGC
jgi:hypothetical protein